MSWEESLFSMFDDLEQQAESRIALEREVELADRGRSEYAAATLESRLMASIDREVVVEVTGPGRLAGTLRRVANGWFLIARPGAVTEWIVRTPALTSAEGLSGRAVPQVAWSPLARLGFGSALRRIAAEGEGCVLHLLDARSIEVRPVRVGADFVEVRLGDAGLWVVSHAAIAAVQRAE